MMLEDKIEQSVRNRDFISEIHEFRDRAQERSIDKFNRFQKDWSIQKHYIQNKINRPATSLLISLANRFQEAEKTHKKNLYVAFSNFLESIYILIRQQGIFESETTNR